MGIREKLNNNPKAGATVAIILLLAAGAAAFALYPRDNGSRFYGAEAYFTDDDGATYFVGDAQTVVPHKRDGKEVVRAHVFRCPSKGSFVAFLQRYTPEAQEALKEAEEAKRAGRIPKNPGLVEEIDFRGSEYKKPGSGNQWVQGSSGDVVVGNALKLCDEKPGEVAELVVP